MVDYMHCRGNRGSVITAGASEFRILSGFHINPVPLFCAVHE